VFIKIDFLEETMADNFQPYISSVSFSNLQESDFFPKDPNAKEALKTTTSDEICNILTKYIVEPINTLAVKLTDTKKWTKIDDPLSVIITTETDDIRGSVLIDTIPIFGAGQVFKCEFRSSVTKIEECLQNLFKQMSVNPGHNPKLAVYFRKAIVKVMASNEFSPFSDLLAAYSEKLDPKEPKNKFNSIKEKIINTVSDILFKKIHKKTN
jgi:hypothetical protein